MKKLILLSLVFLCIFGIDSANAQKKKKGVIDPEGIECDQIFVSVSKSGKIKFSQPVNLKEVSLVDKFSGEVMESLPITKKGSPSIYRTIDLANFSLNFDILIDYSIIQGPVIAFSEPCSRQIVIGQK